MLRRRRYNKLFCANASVCKRADDRERGRSVADTGTEGMIHSKKQKQEEEKPKEEAAVSEDCVVLRPYNVLLRFF